MSVLAVTAWVAAVGFGNRFALWPWVDTLKMVAVLDGDLAVSDGVLGAIATTVQGKIY